nr:cyclic nucleotide-binding domain-containing protein [Cytophagales bacterium]
MFRKDDPLDHLQVLLAGCVRVYMVQGGQQIEFGRNEKGDIMGVLPYSRLRAATGNGDAVEDTTLLSLHRRHFPEMIRTQHELAETFVHLMLNRVRDFTKFQQQYEKMASLGK